MHTRNLLAVLIVTVAFPGIALGQPAVGPGHCVANCGGSVAPPPPPLRPMPSLPSYSGGGGGGGSYSAPAVDLRQAYSVQVNDQGVALANAGNHRAAILKFLQALKINPNNIMARGNLATSLASLSASSGNLAQAIAYQKETCRLLRNASACAPVPNYESNLAAKNGDYARAVTKMREAFRIHPTPRRQQAIGFYQQKLAQQRGVVPFGIAGNPSNVRLQSAARGESQPDKRATVQAADAAKNSGAAGSAGSLEEAKARSGCVFEGSSAGCTAATPIRLNTKRIGKTLLTPAVMSKLSAEDQKKVKGWIAQRDTAEQELAKAAPALDAARKNGSSQDVIAELRGQVRQSQSMIKQTDKLIANMVTTYQMAGDKK